MKRQKYPLIDLIFFTDYTNRNAIKKYYHYRYNPQLFFL